MTSLVLSVASLIVSIVAVAISLSQARLAKRESDRSRPNVKLSAIFTDHLARGSVHETARAVLISVSNTGREETELASLFITSERTILVGTNNRFPDGGPALPYRIAGHSQQHWEIDASAVEEAANAVTITARFGHGEHQSLVVTKDP
ncbi:hypothetical protein [Streptomyces sp. NPDC006668]|uniref:hypothetical protein n=1 Tax=Streptomyces sp. NPDC006668 TaxID=3156903 RepID=UPI0033F751D5